MYRATKARYVKRTDNATGTNCKIDRIGNDLKKFTKDVNNTYEGLVSLEKYSKDFNRHFYNIPESAGEVYFTFI